LESKWRQNVADLEWKDSNIVMAARYLAVPNPVKYVFRSTSGANIIAAITIQPSGLMSLTGGTAFNLPWTLAAQLGMIEPD